jgi:hypothetical protein
MICQAIGTGKGARLRRTGAITSDRDALDALGDVFANTTDPMPSDLNTRVMQAIDPALEPNTRGNVDLDPWNDPEVDAIAPSGAPPADSAEGNPYRHLFECEPWELVGPIELTPEERAEADRVLEDLAGGGILKYPQSMALMNEGGDCCPDPRLHDAISEALTEPDAVADRTPAMAAVSVCIECGDEFEGTGDICSASCGYSLTGEYPPAYEKDYGDG